MKFEDLSIKSKNYQTLTGYENQLHRKLRTYEYKFFLGEELVAKAELEVVKIKNTVPMDLAFAIDEAIASSWCYFLPLFDDKGSFNSLALDKGINIRKTDMHSHKDLADHYEFYEKAALIQEVFVEYKYRRSDIATQILDFIFNQHNDCGVFFLDIKDKKQQFVIPLIGSNEKVKLEDADNLSDFADIPDIEDIITFFKTLRFKECLTEDKFVNLMYIEPQKTHKHGLASIKIV